jgi:hypothetical protein
MIMRQDYSLPWFNSLNDLVRSVVGPTYRMVPLTRYLWKHGLLRKFSVVSWNPDIDVAINSFFFTEVITRACYGSVKWY